MPVPLLDVNAQNHPLTGELQEAFQQVLQSGQFIMGPQVAEFEEACAPFTGSPHNLGVSSGTDALLLALMVLEIGPGDEVIVPAFTFFATAGCVSRLGATPIFADICPETFTIDTDHARKLITPETRAIIPVHLFGRPAAMTAVMDLAREHHLHVIEDAAQSFGARYQDQPTGSIGDFGCFSFFPSKNLGALGDAGLLSCRNPEHAEKARVLRVHGMKPKYCHQEIGANFRIDTLQAAFLLAKIRHLPRYLAQRKRNAARYTEALTRLPGAGTGGSFSRNPETQDPPRGTQLRLILPDPGADDCHTWNQYTIRLPVPGERDALRGELTRQSIGSEVYYPSALNQQPCYGGPGSAALPVASEMAQQVLSLPVYPELPDTQMDKVIAAITRFLQHQP